MHRQIHQQIHRQVASTNTLLKPKFLRIGHDGPVHIIDAVSCTANDKHFTESVVYVNYLYVLYDFSKLRSRM